MSHLDDDGGLSSDFIAVEEPHKGGQQSIWIGVRPIWYGSQPGEVMVQICYQQQHYDSPLRGPVWLSPQTWRDLNAAVEQRLRHYEPLWKRCLAKLTGK